MKLADFIICDDIRQEINRKVTLVGVYGDSINIIPLPGNKVVWPVAMKLCLYVRLQLDNSNELRPGTLFELTCIHGDQELARFEGSILVKEKVRALLALPLGAVFPFPAAGKIIFNLKLKAEGKVYQEFLNERFIEISEMENPVKSVEFSPVTGHLQPH